MLKTDDIVPKQFDALVSSISSVHQELVVNASQAINTILTLRNWLVGAYIHRYEQNGIDRAMYGEALID